MIEKRKVPLKSFHLKPTVRIFHYLQTRILFPMNVNHNYVIREGQENHHNGLFLWK